VPGYLGLEHLGVLPTAIGDEQNINFAVPRYVYDGMTSTAVGADSNGYISVGGTSDPADISFAPQTFPNPDKPNVVLAHRRDLDGTVRPVYALPP
jgi:hypothetical protein